MGVSITLKGLQKLSTKVACTARKSCGHRHDGGREGGVMESPMAYVLTRGAWIALLQPERCVRVVQWGKGV